MKQQKSKIGLQIRHPFRDLSHVGPILGLKPSIIWKRGDERRTPKGNRIKGTRQDSRVSFEFKFLPRRPLSEKIRAALTALEQHRTMLRKLTTTGGTIILYIGWFCDEHTGMTLDTQILSGIANLRISVELFVYVPDTPRLG
ncbi:MAG: DUF4279 domain-containing protein [Bradyrhizobium sp.]|nr:DUF4279 domain-containing protein [Pseudomonadota bacterium]MDE2471407.1 DUF4279 domain-containing protein [Bradyrhizobium sp.]